MWPIIDNALEHNGLITAFAVVGAIMWLSVVLSKYLTFGRVHGSAIAIVIGLVLAWVGGTITGGQKGLADMTLFSGIGLMGGAMLRDFVDRVFDGAPDSLLLHLAKDNKLTEKQRRIVRKLVEEIEE